MTLVVIGRESPVRDRLVTDLRECERVTVVVQQPGDDDIRATLLRLDPEAVLVDIQLADAGGLKLIRAIRGVRTGRMPVVIALSSSTAIQYRTKCHEAGATFFFDAANDHELLLDAIHAIQKELDFHPEREDEKRQQEAGS